MDCMKVLKFITSFSIFFLFIQQILKDYFITGMMLVFRDLQSLKSCYLLLSWSLWFSGEIPELYTGVITMCKKCKQIWMCIGKCR